MRQAKVGLGCLAMALLVACVPFGLASSQAPPGGPTVDLAAVSVEFELEIRGDPHPLSAVRGLAVDKQGNLYVADTGSSRIQKFDSEGEFLTTWGSEGMEDGQFLLRIDLHPAGDVAVDAQGHVYVADSGNSRIQKFDSEGEFLLKWGGLGMGDGQFFMPLGVAVGPEGDVYVTDAARRDVQRFDSEGQFLGKWAVPAMGYNESVAAPAVDAEGNVYVPASESNEIHKFDGDGHLLVRIGETGAGLGQFRFRVPTTAAVDSQGNLYVADEASHYVQVFGIDGNFLRRFGAMGNGEGEIRAPTGLAVGPDGSVYVADINDRVQKFRQQ